MVFRPSAIDQNQAPWLDGSPPSPPEAPLRGQTEAAVVIIGGGFTGVSTAWHLSERFPERRVVLLEAATLANGASGRNSGQMLHWVNGVGYDDPALVRRVWEITEAGIDWIVGLIEQHRLPVRYRRDGCLELSTTPQRAEEAHAHVEAMNALGIPLRYLSGEALSRRLRFEGVPGGFLDPSTGLLNGVDLLRAMKPLLLARGVVIHERTPALRVEPGARITVHTPEGAVKADAAVLATNAYTPMLGFFRDRLFPLLSYMVALGPPAQGWPGVGWGEAAGFCDDLDRIAYGGMTAEGTLLFGGGSNASYSYRYGGATAAPNDSAAAKRGFAAVEQRLHRYLPQTAGLPPSHRWAGPLGITMNRQPAIGVTGEHKNLYYAVGFSGHGVTLANVSGRVLADLYAGEDAAWADLPFVHGRLPYIPPEPLRWAGYHLVTAATGRSPRRR